MTTYVYIIKADTFVKIGYSKNPEKRLKEMQTGSPHDLKLIAKFPYETKESAAAKEKEFHLLFSAWHHRGEWFYSRCMQTAFNMRPEEETREQRALEYKLLRKRRKKQKRPNRGRKRYSKEMLDEANEAGRALKSRCP